MIALLAVLYTSTAQVNGLAARGDTLWAATSGGVERYQRGRRERLYSTEEGLASNDVRSIKLRGETVIARLAAAECVLRDDRFHCTPAAPLGAALPAAASPAHGARITARAGNAVGTAGNGIWSNDQKLTPAGQLCGNHVEALAEFRGRVWVGTFDRGLCILQKGSFQSVETPFRMINDLRVVDGVLYVAAAEGLYLSRDGRKFVREWRIRERGVNHLAASKTWLFITTPASLYALRLGGDTLRRWKHPAGATALQSVSVRGGDVWLASEDAGLIRMRAEKFESFDKASGLPSSWTVDVLATPQGIWGATLRDGFFRIDSEGKLLERTPPAWTLRLYDDRGEIRFGTQDGPRTHAFLRTRDGLFVGTEEGLQQVSAVASLSPSSAKASDRTRPRCPTDPTGGYRPKAARRE